VEPARSPLAGEDGMTGEERTVELLIGIREVMLALIPLIVLSRVLALGTMVGSVL
jgi:hypothetical protein